MSAVLDFIREQEPRFKDVPDEKLTEFVGDEMPDFLKDKEFKAQYTVAKGKKEREAQAAAVRDVKPSAYERIYLETGQKDPGMIPGTELTTAIARDPKAFVKSIPEIAFGVAAGTGRVAYGAAADVTAKLFGDQAKYGGNIAAMERGEEQIPAEKFMGEVSKTNPAWAIAGKFGESAAKMAPLAAMGFLPAWLNRLITAGFAADMIVSAPEQFKNFAEEYYKPKEEQDPDKLTTAWSDLIQTGVFAPLAGAGAVSGLPKGTLNPEVKIKTMLDALRPPQIGGGAAQPKIESLPYPAGAAGLGIKPGRWSLLTRAQQEKILEKLGEPKPEAPIPSPAQQPAPIVPLIPPSTKQDKLGEATQQIDEARAKTKQEVATAEAEIAARQAGEVPTTVGTPEAQQPIAISPAIVETAPLTAQALAQQLGTPEPAAPAKPPVEQGKTDAIPEQKPDASVLRKEGSEVGLPQVGARGAEPQAPAEAQKPEAPTEQGEVARADVFRERFKAQLGDKFQHVPEETVADVTGKMAGLDDLHTQHLGVSAHSDEAQKVTMRFNPIHERIIDRFTSLSAGLEVIANQLQYKAKKSFRFDESRLKYGYDLLKKADEPIPSVLLREPKDKIEWLAHQQGSDWKKFAKEFTPDEKKAFDALTARGMIEYYPQADGSLRYRIASKQIPEWVEANWKDGKFVPETPKEKQPSRVQVPEDMAKRGWTEDRWRDASFTTRSIASEFELNASDPLLPSKQKEIHDLLADLSPEALKEKLAPYTGDSAAENVRKANRRMLRRQAGIDVNIVTPFDTVVTKVHDWASRLMESGIKLENLIKDVHDAIVEFKGESALKNEDTIANSMSDPPDPLHVKLGEILDKYPELALNPMERAMLTIRPVQGLGLLIEKRDRISDAARRKWVEQQGGAVEKPIESEVEKPKVRHGTELLEGPSEPAGGEGPEPLRPSTGAPTEASKPEDVSGSAEQGHPEGLPAGATGSSGAGVGPRDRPGRGPERVPGTGDQGDDGRSDPHGAAEPGRGGAGGGERERGDGSVSEKPEVAPAKRAPANSGNHVITDLEEFERGGAKTKFRDNVEAIKAVRRIIAENRLATPEEQGIIARYVGWGRSEFSEGLFGDEWSSTAQKWQEEREELKALIGEDEFRSARRSTLNAHFTTPKLASAMWRMVRRLGFEGGKVNEPAIGSGIFYGTMPQEMARRSSLVGSELDLLTSHMAKALYPDAKVSQSAFQDAPIPRNWFDLQISNVPFADVMIKGDEFNKVRAVLHDYFFLKSIQTTRPGGLVAFITSTGTLDKSNTAVRRELAKHAGMVAAFRLPEGAFQKGAGTAVVTDVIILRRRADGEAPSGPAWTELKSLPDSDPESQRNYGNIPINEYYAEHPENILGTLDRKSRMYGRGDSHVSMTDDFEQRVEKAITSLPQDCYRKAEGTRPKEPREIVAANTQAKDGGFEVKDDKLWQRDGGSMVQHPATPDTLRLAKSMISLRDQYNKLVAAEATEKTDNVPDAERKRLNELYDEHTKIYGAIHANQRARSIFGRDPDWPNLLAIENWNPETKNATKADILSKRTIKARVDKTSAKDLPEAIGITLNKFGTLDSEHIGKLLGVDTKAAEDQLVASGHAYRLPGGGIELSDHYLSGNVREKLAQAQAAARLDQRFQPNVDALSKVLPEDVPYSEIDARFGSPWVTSGDYQDFIAGILGSNKEDLSVTLINETGKWVLEFANDRAKERLQRNSAFSQLYGTDRADFLDIARSAMDDKPVAIYDVDREGKRHYNAEASAAANLKAEQVRELFKDWLWRDEERRTRLHRYYNDNFNNIVNLAPDGSWLEFPDLNLASYPNGPYKHQRDAVAMALHKRRIFLAHEVGTGKTLTYALTAAKAKEMGFANKPALVVLKANIEQVTEEIKRAFPAKRILSTNEMFDASNRQKTIARIASGDWDLVVMTHDHFNLLDVDKDVERKFIEEEIAELSGVIRSREEETGDTLRGRRGGGKKRDLTVKALEKLKERLEEKLRDALNRPRDPTMSFQKLGVDMVMVDEAHKYKSLPVYTTRGNVKGIPQSRSDRATNMQMNMRWLVEDNPKSMVIFGSGTPVDNSMVELYNWQKYLQPQELTKRGIQAFDSWANTFGQTITKVEPTASGDFKPTTRFKRFSNLPELSQLVKSFMDVKFVSDLPDVKRPRKNEAVVKAPLSPAQEQYMRMIAARADAIKGKRIEKGGDNMLVICTDGRKAALHMGLVEPAMVKEKGGKVGAALQNVLENYRRDPTATQMIFSDLGVNPTDWGFSLYRHMIDELVKGGIPRNKIIDFSKLKEGEQRDNAIKRLREGDALVGIGGTDKMGTGVNAQKRLRYMHHLDAPMTPGRKEQRNGRGWRKGNEHPEVGVQYYVTEGSLDAFVWSLINNKAGFIEQVLRHGTKQRMAEEIDTEELSPARVMAEATGNPDVINAIELEGKVKKLEMQKNIQRQEQYRRGVALEETKKKVGELERFLKLRKQDTARAEAAKAGPLSVEVGGKQFSEMSENLGKAITAKYDEALKQAEPSVMHYDAWKEWFPLAKINGFEIGARFYMDRAGGADVGKVSTFLKGSAEESAIYPSEDPLSVIRSAQGIIRSMAGYEEKTAERLGQERQNVETLTSQLAVPFTHEEELQRSRAELSATVARLQKHRAARATDTSGIDVQIAHAEEQLEESEGPEHVQRLQELRAAQKLTPPQYLDRLNKEIESPSDLAPKPTHYILRSDGKYIPSSGEDIKIEGVPWADVFITHDPEEDRWIVSDKRTGLSLTRADTRDEAIQEVTENLKNYGEERLKKAQDDIIAKYGPMPETAPPPSPEPPAAPPEGPSEEPPAAPGIVGMGGAVAPEFEASRAMPTGIKNLQVELERARRGKENVPQPERLPNQVVHDRVMARIDQDPGWPERLVAELTEKPRTPDQDEILALDYHYVQVQQQHAKIAREMVQAFEDGRQEDVDRHHTVLADWEDKLNKFEQMVKAVGTEWGRSGQMRQRLMNDDYSLAAMTNRLRAAKGGAELTPEERSDLIETQARLLTTQKAWREAEAAQQERMSQLEYDRAVAEHKAASAPRYDKRVLDYAETTVRKMERAAEPARDRAKAKLAKLRGGSAPPPGNVPPSGPGIVGMGGAMGEEFAGSRAVPIDPELLSDLSIDGAAMIARRNLDEVKFTKAMIDIYGDEIGQWMPQIWAESNRVLEYNLAKAPPEVKKVIRKTNPAERIKDIKVDIEAKVKKGEQDDIAPNVNKLVREIVTANPSIGREELLTEVHNILRESQPGITRRETMDAISGYGKYYPLNNDDISVIIRDFKGQMQQLAKLEDIQSRQPPLKTGVDHRSPSDEERRLIKLVNEAKRRYGVVVTDPATQLKSALDARKTYYRNQITDLEAQISARQKFVRTKTPPPTDAELNELKARRDELKREFDQIFPRQGLTDEQRIGIATRALEKSISEFERRIKERDLFPEQKASKTPITPGLEALRTRREALQQELKLLRQAVRPRKTREQIANQAYRTRLAHRIADYQDRIARGDYAPRPKRKPLALDPESQKAKAAFEELKRDFQEKLIQARLNNREWWEKVADWGTKFRRFGVLTSPLVFPKLLSAGLARLTFQPLEEIVGSAARAVPGLRDIAAKAPIEGQGLNMQAEMTGYRAAYTTGLRDAWNVLKKGRSELDVLYGKPRQGYSGEFDYGGKILDFPGRLHGMMKAPIKRAHFERAVALLTEFYGKQQLDISDPIVKARIGVEAYKVANKSIFLADNVVVQKINNFISERIDPKTGHATPGTKVWATAGRTFLPIVRVPVNIVAETMAFSAGLVSGSARAALVLRRGVSSLEPEHADLIMRELKKGSIGAAALLIGYFGANNIGGYYQSGEKRDPDDVKYGSIRMFGVNVGSFWLHNPLIETVQFGATVRRVADSQISRHDDRPKGAAVGVAAAALGLSEEVPFVREMIELDKLYHAEKYGGLPALMGQQAKSVLIPALVQRTAEYMDSEKKRPTTFGEQLESGIPGLRQLVPADPRAQHE